jgi:hypothetical protein
MPNKILRGVYRSPRVYRAVRTPRELRHRINKRAFALSAQAYERYRAELEAAIAEGAVDPEFIDDWRPHSFADRNDCDVK